MEIISFYLTNLTTLNFLRTFMIVHMNVHKNKKMLGTILKDPEHSITFKSTCERPKIQNVNVFNSIALAILVSINLMILRVP
jgi:hypothetical protein